MSRRDWRLRNLSANLRKLCRQHGFTSELCRAIGINRQQFARYLGGEALPSSNNLRRICEYLDVSEEELFLPPDDFQVALNRREARLPLTAVGEVLAKLWLRPEAGMPGFTGFYHVYEPSQPDAECISRSLQHVHEHNGRLHVRSVEGLPPRGPWYGSSRMRCRGMASVLSGRLVTLQYARHSWQPVVLRVCAPSASWWRRTLEGVALSTGAAAGPGPGCVRSVWTPLGRRPDLRMALKQVGVFERGDRSLEPALVERICASAPPVDLTP